MNVPVASMKPEALRKDFTSSSRRKLGLEMKDYSNDSWLADQSSPWLWRLVAYAVAAIILTCLLALVGFLDFRCYRPPRDTTTVDQLAANLPQTLKFALVHQGVTPYVAWIGRSRGATVSGPPVYVFDGFGNLVDHAGDAGDSDNKFVLELYVAAFHAPKATSEEAVTFCQQRRAGPP
jgi:hypothetical protein